MPIVTKRKAAGQTFGQATRRRAAAIAAVAGVAVAVPLAWRLATARTEPPAPTAESAAGRSEIAPHQAGNEVLKGTAPAAPIASEPPTPRHVAARSGSSPHLAGEPPAPPATPAQDAAAETPATEPPARQPPRGREPVFDNQVENRLEAVSRQGFNSIVTLRVNLPQEEIIEILKRPVEIYDDDDEATVAAKERTAEMKAAALDFIEAGGTFNQFLRDCQAEANEARETIRDVREEMKRILEADGVEAAQAYLDRQNPLLREQGLEEVHIGMGLIRAMERRKARQTEQGK